MRHALKGLEHRILCRKELISNYPLDISLNKKCHVKSLTSKNIMTTYLKICKLPKN